jgi:hypothetical protein
MSVVVRPDGWYEYTVGNTGVLCGTCVLEDLRKTASGELAGDEAVTLDMIYELDEEEIDEGVQCDGCLEQSDNYPGPDDD